MARRVRAAFFAIRTRAACVRPALAMRARAPLLSPVFAIPRYAFCRLE